MSGSLAEIIWISFFYCFEFHFILFRACYRNNRHYMYFRLNGQFDKLGVTNQRGLTNALRDSLSKAGKISKLRVSSILVCQLYIS